ncbi:heme anaerobic degradation radical SAM methyltransferase ChuW/HutW [Vibrio sp. SCSIO 43136]|uniref:heme anaerobic degradation radical SAM methyltransferase ChuW/HutW n=1 Tax=Vibrio sp. SCSIO 43136 TaxID=2819101 RepID=UPI0020753A25|nr:heme anaerobic degradation radical SAM methyltransferase ChuW/HutW [Vibrio sp. SCSIO 43136]USD67609.1 heme anaerobic degradation radical SAM methyltransferase ChuW/HutW [Vibrio sp. SCSIO 43136]
MLTEQPQSDVTALNDVAKRREHSNTLPNLVLDESMTGRHTPDPLKFAFDKKSSAHAGGGMRKPIAKTDMAAQFAQMFNTQKGTGNKRVIYIHIPFCQVRCTYCNFFEYASSQKLIDEYFEVLVKEIKLRAAQPWTQVSPFHAVYIGGGTPTDLTASQIERLGKLIRQSFPLHNDCEITFEGRIHKFSDDKFAAAIEGGFNRFSFGVQSFNTKVRRAAKRLDDREVVMARLRHFAQQDVAPIVIDLLLGLPHMTAEIFAQDLEDFKQTGAHGVDLYQLIGMEGLPMHRMVEQGKLPAPMNTAEKAELFKMGEAYLASHQYRQLSACHWANDARERSLYNSYAKTSAEVLPIGAGAGGNVAGFAYMQTRDLKAYSSAIESQQVPAMMLIQQHPHAMLQGFIKASMDKGMLDLNKLAHMMSSLDEHLFASCRPLLQAWQENGLVDIANNYVVATQAGRFWAVNLAQALLKCVDQGTAGK